MKGVDGLLLRFYSNSDLNYIDKNVVWSVICIFQQSMHQFMFCALGKVIQWHAVCLVRSHSLLIMLELCSYVRLFSCLFQPSVCSHIFMWLWEGGKRPCEPPPTEGKVEQWSTREWAGAWVISAPAAHAQRWGRIKVCECIRACLPGILLFNYFIPVLVYPGASFRVGSPICIYIRQCMCVRVCQGIDRWAGASCLLRDLRTVQAWFFARAQSKAHHTSAVAWTSHHHQKTYISIMLPCFSFYVNLYKSLIPSVCFFLSCRYICSFSSPFRMIDYLPPGHRFDTWLYSCSSFNPPCTVLLVHMLSICG